MNKLERDGKIAVLISPGYGAGWSTWAANEHQETMCMDAEIVQAALDNDMSRVKQLACEKCEDPYLGAIPDLAVVWVDKGSEFEIEEYDGSESIHIIGDRHYFTA